MLLEPAKNLKNGKRWTTCVNGKLIGTDGLAIEWAHPQPSASPNRGSKSPHFKFQPISYRLMKISLEHILGYIGWLWSGAMNNHTSFAKAQMSESRSSTICVLVERPNHHCGNERPCIYCLSWYYCIGTIFDSNTNPSISTNQRLNFNFWWHWPLWIFLWCCWQGFCSLVWTDFHTVSNGCFLQHFSQLL